MDYADMETAMPSIRPAGLHTSMPQDVQVIHGFIYIDRQGGATVNMMQEGRCEGAMSPDGEISRLHSGR